MSHGDDMPESESALLVLVPAADPVVGPHRDRLDLSARDGVPAYLTVLYPFLPPERIGPGELIGLVHEDVVTGNLASVYPDQADTDSGLLGAAFGRTRFVYLRRGSY